MQRNLLLAITSLIVVMSVVQASPMPTAAPMIRRQDSGSQTTAPYTSTYDPSQGFSGSGCNLSNGVAVCCPAGYQNQSINGATSCVKVGSGGNSGGSDDDDDGDDDDDDGNGNSDTDTGVQSGATTYTSDGAIVVSHGITQSNVFSTHIGASTSISTSSGSNSGSSNRSGSNDASITRIPISLVLAVIGGVVIGAL